VLFSKTLDIAHSADGTKTLTASAWIDHNAPITSNEQSYSQKLTTIPRASTLTASNGTLGTAQTLTISRASSSFRHLLTATCGSFAETILNDMGASSGTTSKSWTPKIGWAQANTKGTSVSITLTLSTFSGDTHIGTDTKTISCAIPTSVKPSCSIQVLDATDTKDTYGNLVKGLSKLYVKTTPTLAHGSSIKSYNVVANSMIYNGAEITTGLLSAAGTTTVTAKVTDNRGRTSEEATASFPVLDYNKPQITSLVVHRCNEDGTENEQGEFCEVRFSAKITPLNNKNSATYELSYTKNSTGATTKKPLTELTGDYTVTNFAYIFAADSGSSYAVTITATDDIAPTVLGTSVSTAFTLYNCHKSGTGWAFGKVAENENTLENALELRQIANSYAYQPSAFNGEKGYTLLATIQLKELNVNAPIVFVINKRGVVCPMTVYVCFASSSTTTDPELASITYEGDNFGAFLVKGGTSLWSLYVDNTTGWSNPCLQEWYTTDNQNARIKVTFPSEQVETLPTPYWRATPTRMRSILDYVYPVGSIYLSYSHVSPADMFGGEWVRIEDAFLWATTASGTIGQTGGEKTHTLTVDELPAHSHTSKGMYVATGSATGAMVGTDTPSGTASADKKTNNTGGGKAHNNMPPYIQISAWRRTA
jgi:adhesin HecA-like repeat protein